VPNNPNLSQSKENSRQRVGKMICPGHAV
jgi:hypothetical protein